VDVDFGVNSIGLFHETTLIIVGEVNEYAAVRSGTEPILVVPSIGPVAAVADQIAVEVVDWELGVRSWKIGDSGILIQRICRVAKLREASRAETVAYFIIIIGRIPDRGSFGAVAGTNHF